MKKTLALLLVASLLLAGCTELSESDDGETLKIEVNEDIAIEKINDFMTVDEGESFGITMMYDMDPSMMGMDGGMLEVDEDSEAVITMEMTEAWSPDGYHTSEISGISNGDSSMKFVSTMTHIGTTMYFEIGYEITGNICAEEDDAVEQINSTMEEKYGEDWEELATEDELEEASEAYSEAASCEWMEQMMEAQPASSYSMTTTTTHTEVIAAMAEESQNDGDEMDPMGMLMIFSFVECMGTFTPAESVDGLQIYNVTMEGMDEDSMTPELVLCMFDTDDGNTISFEEFLAADDSGEEVDDDEVAELKIIFDESDIDADGELNSDELVTFIEAMDNYDEEHDEGDDHDGHDDMGDDEDPEMMPDMSVAFNNAGEIEYFEMSMDEMGDQLTVMKMYVLTEDRVSSLFTDVNAGTLVALPFSITGSMDDDDQMFTCDDGETIPMDWVNDGMNDCDGGEDEWDDNSGGSGDSIVTFLTDNWAMGEEIYTAPEFYVYSGFDQIDEVSFSLADSDGSILDTWTAYPSDFTPSEDGGMVYFVNLDGASVDEECYTLYATWITTDMSGGQTERDDICFDRTEAGDDSDDDAPSPADLLSLADSDSDGELTPEEFFAFLEMDEGCCLPDEMKSDINDIMNNSDSDSSGTLSESELETFIMDFVSYQDSMEGGEDDGEMDDDDGGEDSPSPQELLDMTDTDSNGAMTMDEFNAYMNQDGETMPQEMIDEFNAIFDEADTDDSGDLDINELEQFITAIDNYMMSMEDSEETFTCDNGETIPLDYVDDGEEDCSDGSDESNMDDDHGDNHDHGDDGGHGHGDEDGEIVMYITSEMDFHFEGDMSDYKIELTSCDYDYDMETGEETSTCTTVMSVAMTDAGMGSSVMFHDADSSGTISVGDMIHIGETDVEWDEVRLYSISADAYSDENPLHNAPGFTGLVGMLALLGAAFIRRNE